MNNTNTVLVGTPVPNNTIVKNVLAWREAKKEQIRRQRAATEARSFRVNFGSVGLAFPKGFSLAA